MVIYLLLFFSFLYFIWLLFLLKLKTQNINFDTDYFLFFFSRKTFLISSLYLILYFGINIFLIGYIPSSYIYFIHEYITTKFCIFFVFFILCNFFYKNNIVKKLFNTKSFLFFMFIFFVLPMDYLIVEWFYNIKQVLYLCIFYVIISIIIYLINKKYDKILKKLYFFPILMIFVNVFLFNLFVKNREIEILKPISIDESTDGMLSDILELGRVKKTLSIKESISIDDKNKKIYKKMAHILALYNGVPEWQEKALVNNELDFKSLFSKIENRNQQKLCLCTLSTVNFLEKNDALLFLIKYNDIEGFPKRKKYVLSLIPEYKKEKFYKLVDNVIDNMSDDEFNRTIKNISRGNSINNTLREFEQKFLNYKTY